MRSANDRFPAVSKDPNAIGLLLRDHRYLEQLFGSYRDAAPGGEWAQARRLCDALAVHLQVEAEIFYPAVSDALGESIPGDGAEHQQATLVRLLTAVEQSESEIAAREAMSHLEHAFAQHRRAEENTVFRAVVQSDVDLIGVGAALLARGNDLHEERTSALRSAPSAIPRYGGAGRSGRA